MAYVLGYLVVFFTACAALLQAYDRWAGPWDYASDAWPRGGWFLLCALACIISGSWVIEAILR